MRSHARAAASQPPGNGGNPPPDKDNPDLPKGPPEGKHTAKKATQKGQLPHEEAEEAGQGSKKRGPKAASASMPGKFDSSHQEISTD